MTHIQSSAQAVNPIAKKTENKERKNQCFKIGWLPDISKVEDEPLMFGNKITCSWSYLLYISDPSRGTFILYMCRKEGSLYVCTVVHK